MVNKYLSAFTLIELMVVVVIGAILLTLAIPSYFSIIESNEIESSANQLAADINYARMEAIRRGDVVSVCAAQTSAQTSCGNSTNWLNGWIVFIDVNNNGQITNGAVNILAVSPVLATAVTVAANTGVIQYNSTGALTSTPLNLLMSSANCNNSSARTLTVPASGQLSIVQTAC